MEYESPHWIHLHNTHWIHLIDHVAVRQEKQRRRKRILIVFWRSRFHTLYLSCPIMSVCNYCANTFNTELLSCHRIPFIYYWLKLIRALCRPHVGRCRPDVVGWCIGDVVTTSVRCRFDDIVRHGDDIVTMSCATWHRVLWQNCSLYFYTFIL